MPYTFKLTWVRHANRWRKRYLGRTHYLKTTANGRKDRQGYLAAYREWERLKAFIDGLGPNPYTETGAIIPEDQIANVRPTYFPPMPSNGYRAGNGLANGMNGVGNGHPNGMNEAGPIVGTNGKPKLEPARLPDDPAWVLSRGIGAGLYPEQIVTNGNGNPYTDERGLNALADWWLEQRKKSADRGELSLKQWAEDKTNLQAFRGFLMANFPTLLSIDQLDASILNLYRDKQWEFVGQGISKVTLRKRLATVVRFIKYLIDQNVLRESPKDLTRFAKVKLDKPKPEFFSLEETKLSFRRSPREFQANFLSAS